VQANGKPNPCTDQDEILHPHPHRSKEGFGAGLTPAPPPLGLGGLKSLKADRNIFENCLQSKGCSAGCKFTWVPQLVAHNPAVVKMKMKIMCIFLFDNPLSQMDFFFLYLYDPPDIIN